jgi:hypothetical protein
MKSPVRGREGVSSLELRRSKRPNTLPSRCGVGPIEVGVGALAEAGERKSLRFREGVV